MTPTLWQIFLTFLKLGCTSFGGPAAHLVFFHQVFVQQRQWLQDTEYAQLVALAQLLPGPTSSQVGIGIGYLQKGYAGGFCAWLGFTLPSALLMTVFALLSYQVSDLIHLDAFHAIQLIVMAVVAVAFWQMLTSFCKQTWHYLLMLAATLFILLVPIAINQILVILVAALLGVTFSKENNLTNREPLSLQILQSQSQHHRAWWWLFLFFALFVVFALLQGFTPSLLIESIQGFYQTAALVFGGGHVVLPLLHQQFVSTHLIPAQQFDLGYALAQLIPGPLFTFASFIGAFIPMTPFPLLNAAIATLAIFLPSFLLIFALLPYWSRFMAQAKIQKAVTGINAAVVGLLFAMVISMGMDQIRHWSDLLFVVLVIALLKTKLPVLISIPGSFLLYLFLQFWI